MTQSNGIKLHAFDYAIKISIKTGNELGCALTMDGFHQRVSITDDIIT